MNPEDVVFTTSENQKLLKQSTVIFQLTGPGAALLVLALDTFILTALDPEHSPERLNEKNKEHLQKTAEYAIMLNSQIIKQIKSSLNNPPTTNN